MSGAQRGSPINNGMGGSPGDVPLAGGYPKVTEAQVVASIAATNYFTHGTLTVCIATMANGFSVVGTAAAASPENFDADLGQQLALKDAQRQVWPLLGYQLRESLWLASQPGATAKTTLSSITGGLAGAGTMNEVEASRTDPGGGDGSQGAEDQKAAAIQHEHSAA